MKYDVAIVGGGPGGSTCASFLKKYAPNLSVVILERETFPRDHVGESQLPGVSHVLDELGIWDQVEAAGFPIKVGATYRWGKSDDLWDFNFLPRGRFADEVPPAKYAGQRLFTAFQVDRAIYDKILLDHARALGVEVRENCGVAGAQTTDGRIDALTLRNGESVEARMFVDASGHTGVLRRSVGVQVQEPSSLRNVAFWDYWQNAEWAVSLGIGGTRIQIMSLGYGWIWFIPLGPTRTSVGFVCPADYYLKSGMKPVELYLKAMADEPRVAGLLAKAEREGKFASTKDWSFVADKLAGENWMLVGESAGFADPILSAGLTLTHVGAKEAAFTILELFRGGKKDWLYEQYTGRNQRRIHQHIRFADYWYSANSHFSELKEFTSEIAQEAGLELGPEAAFRWLGTGGFVDEDVFVGGLGTYTFAALHEINRWMLDGKLENAYGGMNAFDLDLTGAKKVQMPHYEKGRVLPVEGYVKGKKVLPLSGMIGRLVRALQVNRRIVPALKLISAEMRKEGLEPTREVIDKAMETLEALVRDGWVKGRFMPGAEALSGEVLEGSLYVTRNRDDKLPPERRASSIGAEEAG